MPAGESAVGKHDAQSVERPGVDVAALKIRGGLLFFGRSVVAHVKGGGPALISYRTHEVAVR
jgi:hypothetical protein